MVILQVFDFWALEMYSYTCNKGLKKENAFAMPRDVVDWDLQAPNMLSNARFKHTLIRHFDAFKPEGGATCSVSAQTMNREKFLFVASGPWIAAPNRLIFAFFSRQNCKGSPMSVASLVLLMDSSHHVRPLLQCIFARLAAVVSEREHLFFIGGECGGCVIRAFGTMPDTSDVVADSSLPCALGCPTTLAYRRYFLVIKAFCRHPCRFG